MIELYSAGTPNGHKASCTLEELGLDYEVHKIDLGAKEQKSEAFLTINPNGRIPAIIDRGNADLAVFESGAIMVYLAEKAGKLLPSESEARARVMSWLMFQMGGIGPMMGQANVFYRYMEEKIPVAIDRYQGETRRLFSVLDNGLAESQWLAGEFSIADIANWCWVRTHKLSGVSPEEFLHLMRWLDDMQARTALQRGVTIPASLDHMLKD